MQKYPFIFSDAWKYRIQRHAAFWIFWWLFQGFLYSFLSVNSSAGYFRRLPISMIESFCFMVNHMFLAYSLMYFVIPRFLLKQKYWQTAAWTFLFFLLTAGISSIVGRLVVDQLRASLIEDPEVLRSFRKSSLSFHLSLLAGLRGGITIGGIAAAIKLMKYWYVKEQRNLQLQKENAESQLQLLKAQVHPHFLFNTLNNIYSFSLENSPKTPGLILKLSSLLSYMLYDCKAEEVLLEKEIEVMKNYIDLEKERYGNKIDISLNIEGDIKDKFISPLLLLPFLENAFKHGTSEQVEKSWLSIDISVEKFTLRCKIVNSKNEVVPVSQNGIGIQNVKQRLQFLYPHKHELKLTDEGTFFVVSLLIELVNYRYEYVAPSRVTSLVNENILT